MPRAPRKLLFVSHVTEDAAVGAWLKAQLTDDFHPRVEVFVSSDGEGISAGAEWLAELKKLLEECAVFIALCTPASIHAPWINFEAGAAWTLGRPIVPACHGGLGPEMLPMPFSILQAITLAESHGLRSLYRKLVDVGAGEQLPDHDFAALARDVPPAMDPPPLAADGSQLDPESAIRDRLREALERTYQWRTPEWLAAEAAVTVDEALRILRADPAVRFTRGANGTVAGLRSRVDP